MKTSLIILLTAASVLAAPYRSTERKPSKEGREKGRRSALSTNTKFDWMDVSDSFHNVADSIEEEQEDVNKKSGSKVTISSTGKKIDWKTNSLPSFSRYTLRIKSDVALCDPNVVQVSGYLDVDDKSFYFWFFESRSSPDTDPLVLWLNGGSMLLM